MISLEKFEEEKALIEVEDLKVTWVKEMLLVMVVEKA